MGVKISVEKRSSAQILQERLKQIPKKAVYVGIPSSTAKGRSEVLTAMAEKIASAADARGRKASKRQSKKYQRLLKSAQADVNNAELLFLFTKGSPLRNQPARPVIEPAIEAKGNRERIADELAHAVEDTLDGKPDKADGRLRRAGMTAQNAARAWFTDGRNGWAPNAPRTIREKGSDQPGINTAQMRKAITYVVKDDDA